MTATRSHDWRVILLAVVGAAGALICLALSASIAAYSVVTASIRSFATTGLEAEELVNVFVLSGGMALVAGVLIATSLAALESLRGRANPAFESKPLAWWVVAIWILVWLGASALAQFLRDGEHFTWAIPIVQLLAIVVPINVLARLAIAGIRGGTRLRMWGSVALGMLLATGLSAVLEILLLAGALTVGGVYLLENPEELIALQRLATQLAGVTEPEESMAVLAPILSSPGALLVALAAVAVATPLLEELAKSIPVWAQYDRLSKGADGFWAGALCGAGFALFEGLMISVDASEGLAAILVLRAGSSLMHILASGLAGWGIAVFRGTGKAAPMLGGYAAAIAMHALWNAVVVAIGYGAIRTMYAAVQPDAAGLVFSAAGVMLLVLLIGLLPIALISLNLRFRQRNAASVAVGPSSGTPDSAPGVENASEAS